MLRELASNNAHASGAVAGKVHLMRPRATTPRCRLGSMGVGSRQTAGAVYVLLSSWEDDNRHSQFHDSRDADAVVRGVFSGVRAALLVGGCLLLAGCRDATPAGKCVGLNGHEDSTLVYEYDAQNIFWGVVGVELVYPPIKVALDELKCPVAARRGRGVA